MNRAYSTLEIKALHDEDGKRRFSGVASTPSTDRMGDVVEPKGAQFKLPIPLLWQHDAKDPIGWVTSAKVTPKGIEVECEVATVSDDGPLKDRLTNAWQMLKAKLVRGLSIGFNSLESARIDGTYGIKFSKWEWLELSAVTIPANQDASIMAIKSIDDALLASSGNKQGSHATPGASGTKQQAASGGFSISRSQKGKDMKTINEQLNELREVRATKAARMGELAEQIKAGDDVDGAEFDALEAEVSDLDNQIRVKRVEAMNASAARQVEGHSSKAATGSRGPTIIVKGSDVDDKFQGQSYTRLVIAKALARIYDADAASIAEARWGKSNPSLVRLLKAGVAGGGSGSGEWGAELVAMDGRYTGDFIEYLTSKTVYDKLPLRQVPANVTIKGQDGTATGYWVGQSKAIPVSTADFSTVNLTPLKVAALAVVSNELLRDSSPAAEMLVRDSLVDASSQRVDNTFLSATAASAGVSPAGLLNGVTGVASSGTDAAALRADIMALYQPFLTAKNANGIQLVMTPSTAKAISLLVNALGQTEFPGLTAAGGMLLGDPVVTGDNVTSGHVIAIKPSDVYRIGDTGVQVSISREAMIEQDTAPQGASDTPTAASATLMSMFQTESTAIKVVRSINFAKRRTGAVQFIQDAEYGGVVS
jgi:HK97 family phage prohead protease